MITKDLQYYKFCLYGFLKNLKFFDAFFILFLAQKGLSYTQIGLLYGIREIFINIFEIPSGIIADSYGRKNSLIASFIFYIISFIIFFISNSFWLFLVAFLFYGLGDAFRSGTHKGMMMDYLKLNNISNQKIAYYGNTRSWSQKGAAISSLIAGIIVFYSGSYNNIFIYSIIPYLINLILIISYPKEINYSRLKFDKKTSLESLGALNLLKTIKNFLKTIKEPNVLKIINSSALHSAYLKAVKDYIQPLMVNISLTIPLMMDIEGNKKNGLIIGIIYFFIFLLTSKASKSADKISKITNISYITLISGFFLGLISGLFFIYNLWSISLVFFVGIYIIENIRKPILTGFISDNVPNEILTSVISAQSLLKTFITAIIAFLFGFLTDNFGLGFAFMIISLFLIVITYLIYFLNKRSLKNRTK